MHRQYLSGANKNVVRQFICVAFATVLLVGCGNLPSAGPSGRSFGKAQTEYTAPTSGPEADDAKLPFVLVHADRKIILSGKSRRLGTYLQ